MTLHEQLAAYKAEFARNAAPERVALYEAKIEELRTEFAQRNSLRAGDEAPDFTLPSAKSGPITLSTLLRDGPVVLTFYRGGWCPYCNIQLRAYQAALAELQAFDARLLAISPQMPDKSLSTAETNALAFDVLSDVGNGVAQSYGLAYTMPIEIQQALRAANKALPDMNGDESWVLPVPATYVIDRNHRIATARLDIDYRDRLGPEEIIATLKRIAS